MVFVPYQHISIKIIVRGAEIEITIIIYNISTCASWNLPLIV